MTKESFESRGRQDWAELDQMIKLAENNGKVPIARPEKLPLLFRQACADLALAERRVYPRQLCDDLHQLVVRGFNLIRRSQPSSSAGVLRFFSFTFPETIRREWQLFLFCLALFWVPFFSAAFSIHHDVIWVQSLIGDAGMLELERVYSGDDVIAKMRENFDSNFMMFAFYVMNNISINFTVFASGILACLGTIFFTIFNGLMIGASTGYIHYACNPESFYRFVAGHSSWELLSISVSAMAGMKIGLAVLNPGRMQRGLAIAKAAHQAIPLLLGATAMMFTANVIEGFWSGLDRPANLKYGVGIAGWLFFLVYFLFAGRDWSARSRIHAA